jgi:hypothetical protein
MEVGQGPNWGCSAKGKKSILIMFNHICYEEQHGNFLMSQNRNCHRKDKTVDYIFIQCEQNEGQNPRMLQTIASSRLRIQTGIHGMRSGICVWSFFCDFV